MVYLESFDEFAAATKNLYLTNPLRTRYLVKYRAEDEKLVLKTTDDVSCFQYKTCHQADLKHIDQLTQQMVELMGAQEVGKEIPDDIEMEVLPEVKRQESAGPKAGKKKKK